MASSADKETSSMPPRPGSGPATEIDPQLENVLRNLNVNLEDELTRYRRQRHGRVAPPPPPRRAAQRQSIDLISVPASASDEGAPDASTPGASSPDASSQLSAPPPPPPNPFLNKTDELEEDVELPDMDPISELAELGLDEGEVIDSGEGASDLAESALSIQASNTSADSYLESSEELLKSIEEEQVEPSSVPEPYSPERKNNGLLKLAGLVLVLLGGIGVGFAITYPSQLQNLRARLWPAGEPEPNEAVTDAPADAPPVADGEGSQSDGVVANTPPASSSVEASDPDGYKPSGPDLSTREFKELDDVKDLVTLDVDGSGNAPAGSSPLPNPAQSPLPNPAQSPLPNPAQSPLPNSAATSTDGQPTAAAPAAATPETTGAAPTTPAAPAAPSAPTTPVTTTPAAGSNFYIIASYTGDASLSKAREFVPDAFVRNFKAGARIQMAAFNNRAQAEEQVAVLIQQGIAVELFGPTNE
ncbi:MAG: SPOR domain-containing protein [Leptolyngbyaceae cyanobacterium MAG.088]|nr:SPOR domain-containing protein [Leptolyngbyaceae cyanobacterium MAG.088]